MATSWVFHLNDFQILYVFTLDLEAQHRSDLVKPLYPRCTRVHVQQFVLGIVLHLQYMGMPANK
jgi:hypothetical protein